MSDVPINRRAFLLQAAGLAGVCTLAAAAEPVRAAGASARERRMLFHGTGFQPMTAIVRRGETLRIDSVATRPLHLRSAPTAPQPVEQRIARGQSVALALSAPGVYLLYDALTTHFDPQFGQVVARADAPHFPLPAYAAVLVTDGAGGGVPLTAPEVTIADTAMTFQPWSVVCRAGATLRFTNDDMDPHVLMPVPSPGRHAPFRGVALPARGGRATLRLDVPGLYHYYCPLHARYRSADFTFEPLRTYGSFPIVMDGLIAVLPASGR